MKQYSLETMFLSLADALSVYLKTNRVNYERSGAFGGYYFTITCTPDQADAINAFIDANSITCM